MRKRKFSFLLCERVEIKSTKKRQDDEVGVADTVVWRNSHKAMLRPNESTRWFDFLKNTYPFGITNCSVMYVAYQDCQHSHNYYQCTNLLLYPLTGEGEKSYKGSQIPQCPSVNHQCSGCCSKYSLCFICSPKGWVPSLTFTVS